MITTNLRRRFQAVIVSIVVLVVSLVVIMALSLQHTKVYVQQAIGVDALIVNLYELQVLSHEYVETPSERVRQQWGVKFNQIKSDLCKRGSTSDEVTDATHGVQLLFDRLISLPEVAPGLESVQKRHRGQVVAALTLESQRVIDWAAELSRQTKESIVPRLMLIGAAMLAVMLATSVVAIAIMLVTTRRICLSVNRLNAGADEIAGGRLGFQVEESGNDEMATLAVSINRMSRSLVNLFENLRIKTVALEQEIEEHKLADAREQALREKLERAARMESLGVLAGGVAHDLNNILGPLVLLPDLAIEYIEQYGDPADPEHAETLESMQTIKASALRAVGVVSDLVVMGRRGQFQKSPLDVNWVIAQLMAAKQIRDIQARRPDVQVSKQLSAEPLWCLGSENRLVRVLANLVGNAAEAIKVSGNVVVRTARATFTEPYSGHEVVPAGDYVTVTVTDTGCGMDAKTMARSFEPFFSTKAPGERSGSGLGLSVVHGLVKDHAGFLDVQSVLGQGTTFTVYLPAVTEGEVGAVSSKEQLPGGHERILVVDDELGQQVVARHLLKKLGYAATAVSSGEEALALFETAGRVGQPAPFDLVLTDMIMAGIDGLATCKAILELYPGQKLMIVSGQDQDGHATRIKDLGVRWLNKPYADIELARAVRAGLDG